MAKIETIRYNGRTTSEVRKQYRQWYEDNRAKVSIVNEHEIERLRLQIRRQQDEVVTLQRSGIGTASAELLLARMQASVDALCIKRDKLVS